MTAKVACLVGVVVVAETGCGGVTTGAGGCATPSAGRLGRGVILEGPLGLVGGGGYCRYIRK
ncbi:MAG: hypothetical protein LVR00_03770 [Rhabdochlamydiaceae bacterium]